MSDDLPCVYPVGHRYAKDHHCDCICSLRRGHSGKHRCAYEQAQVKAAIRQALATEEFVIRAKEILP